MSSKNFQFHYGDVNLTDQDVSMNFAIEDTAAGAYDILLFSQGDYFSGDYLQDDENSGLENVRVNFTIDTDAVNKGAFFYVNESATVAGQERTSYGNGLVTTGTYYSQDSVTNINTGSAEVPLSLSGSSIESVGISKLIPMVNLANPADVNSSTKVLTEADGESGIKYGLLQAVNAALFKKLGKDVAVLNDNALVTSLADITDSTSGIGLVNETDKGSDSRIFQRYIDSGRFAEDTADVANAVNMDLTSFQLSFRATITGTISDSTSFNSAAAISFDGAGAVRNRVFGTLGTDTLVQADGSYSINAMVILRQQA